MSAPASKLLGLLLTLALLLQSCSARSGWDVRALEDRHPELSAHPGQRLTDASPYFVPSATGLVLFLCRWSTEHAVPVRLPVDATHAERELLQRSLRAWEGVGLGLTFRVVEPERGSLRWRGIEIDFVDDPERGAPTGSGDTVADCAISADFPAPSAATTAASAGRARQHPIAAELEVASVYLRRTRSDPLGRTQPLSSTELLGAAVHELGHALGFSGHVAWGDSVMSAHGQIDSARRWGRRLEAGSSLEAPTLRALYALPSGVRLGSLSLSDSQLEPLRELARLARAAQLRGPFVRVSEQSARIFWRDRDAASFVLGISEWGRVARNPELFELRTNARAQALLRNGAVR